MWRTLLLCALLGGCSGPSRRWEFCYDDACGNCRGARTLRCQACAGAGVVECPTCRGSGIGACEACEGAGLKAGFEACGWCSGSGRTGSCPRCPGTGKAPCLSCEGRGQKRCGRWVDALPSS
jgi:hypothetical protein